VVSPARMRSLHRRRSSTRGLNLCADVSGFAATSHHGGQSVQTKNSRKVHVCVTTWGWKFVKLCGYTTGTTTSATKLRKAFANECLLRSYACVAATNNWQQDQNIGIPSLTRSRNSVFWMRNIGSKWDAWANIFKDLVLFSAFSTSTRR